MNAIAGCRTYRLFKRKVGKKHLYYARLICPETGKIHITISTEGQLSTGEKIQNFDT